MYIQMSILSCISSWLYKMDGMGLMVPGKAPNLIIEHVYYETPTQPLGHLVVVNSYSIFSDCFTVVDVNARTMR